MASDWRLNGFMDAEQLSELYEATELRQSCRHFASAPTTEQWRLLLDTADRCALRGVRIALGMCDTSLFRPMLGLFASFENVQRFAAIIVMDSTTRSVVNAGVSGEAFLLTAVRNGMAGCWVTGTFKRSQVGLHLAAGEKLLGLIALGNPITPPSPPLTRKRKPLAELCMPDPTAYPLAFREVAQCVRIAPSAMNYQPWRMTLLSDTSLRVAVSLPAQRLDLGIAMCHATLAIGATSAIYSLAEDGLSATIEL